MKPIVMKKIVFSKIIKGYEEVIVKELAERMCDIIFMTANEKAREVINELKDVKMNGEDTIGVEYNFDFVVNDAIQIIGRIKRDEMK